MFNCDSYLILSDLGMITFLLVYCSTSVTVVKFPQALCSRLEVVSGTLGFFSRLNLPSAFCPSSIYVIFLTRLPFMPSLPSAVPSLAFAAPVQARPSLSLSDARRCRPRSRCPPPTVAPVRRVFFCALGQSGDEGGGGGSVDKGEDGELEARGGEMEGGTREKIGDTGGLEEEEKGGVAHEVDWSKKVPDVDAEYPEFDDMTRTSIRFLNRLEDEWVGSNIHRMYWYEEQKKKRGEALKEIADAQNAREVDEQGESIQDIIFEETRELKEQLQEIQDITGGDLVSESGDITSNGWALFAFAFFISIYLSFTAGWLVFGLLSKAFPADTPLELSPIWQWLSFFQ